MNKVIENGMVKILVSYGYGAGWSTWSSDNAERMLFDPKLIEMKERGATKQEVQEYMESDEWEGDIPYLGGWNSCIIEEIPKGAAFEINEYDGSESIQYRDGTNWFKA